MTTDTTCIYEAARLIYLSLAHSSGNKRIAAQNSVEMGELTQRFQAEEPFRQAVDAGLRAMELRLLARSDLRAADLLPVHCAVAAAFFPTEADLDAPVEGPGGHRHGGRHRPPPAVRPGRGGLARGRRPAPSPGAAAAPGEETDVPAQ